MSRSYKRPYVQIVSMKPKAKAYFKRRASRLFRRHGRKFDLEWECDMIKSYDDNPRDSRK